MLFRAVFWIGVVALLAPAARESSVQSGATSPVSESPWAPVIANFQDALLDRLAAAKADIEAAERAHPMIPAEPGSH